MRKGHSLSNSYHNVFIKNTRMAQSGHILWPKILDYFQGLCPMSHSMCIFQAFKALLNSCSPLPEFIFANSLSVIVNQEQEKKISF